MTKNNGRTNSKIHDTDNRYKAKKFGTFIGYFLTIVLVTIVYSDKLGGLTVALFVAGAGIAFATQEVIAYFAGWLAIIFGEFRFLWDEIPPPHSIQQQLR